MSASPLLLGILYDYPQHDGGASFEEAVRHGLQEVELDRPVELVPRQAAGLPGGTAHDVHRNFNELVDAGVLAIIGPSISDNGLLVRDWADEARVPCVNYTGGERTRSAFMFHYQVGSLAEEPIVLAEHLRARELRSAVVIHDKSPVGSGYVSAFEAACARTGVEVVGRAAISPLADEAGAIVDRLRQSKPDALVYLGMGAASHAVAVAKDEAGWDVTVVANSALMFGYARKDWRPGFEGWAYVDTVSDGNVRRQALKERAPKSAAGPVGVAAYDIGRLVAEGLARAVHLTGDGVREGLEEVKRLPAATGYEGTTMGFGNYDHAALKGGYLVLRQWKDGKTVEL
ncbi:MAG TPA: ABC transporter substrate-binding protein [Acidimicrobiales bacterium]|nr:ABC transporter substrate-binding protein [Acidimicrobiales bacterium]